MADISKELEDFKNAIYGEDVRQSMISAFNAINNSTEGLAAEAKASEDAAANSAASAKNQAQEAASSAVNAKDQAQAAADNALSAKNQAQEATKQAETAQEAKAQAGEYAEEASKYYSAAGRFRDEVNEVYEKIQNIGNLKEYAGCKEDQDGIPGMVPTATAGNVNRVLSADGKWKHILAVDIVMQGDQYGYIGERGMFFPFKNQADIDAAVSAAKVGNAVAADVRAGKTFTNGTSSGLTGTFAAQEKTITASRTVQTVAPDSGKWLSKVTVNKFPDATGTYEAKSRGNALDMGAGNNLRYVNTNNVPNTNSGTYTYSANSTGGTVDLGAANTYRYVNAGNVYNKGKSDGHADTRSDFVIQTKVKHSGLSCSVTVGWRLASEDYKIMHDAFTFEVKEGQDLYTARQYHLRYNQPYIYL